MSSTVTARTWGSKSALVDHLQSTNPRSPIVGLNAEAPGEYYSFAVAWGREQAEIGVISSGHGTSPAALLMEEARRVLVGHDTWISWIDLDALAVVKSRRLGGVFFEFLPVERDDEIVILHELGALRVNAMGEVRWFVDTDVVEASSVDATGKLILSVMDGPGLAISLASGIVSTLGTPSTVLQ